MAFDFDNNIEIDDIEIDESVVQRIEMQISEYIEQLNIAYLDMIKSSKSSYGTYNSYEKDQPFEYKSTMRHKNKAVHFYTRNIKNSGLGAWNTLLFWVNTYESHKAFSEIYFDGAALCTFNFYLETLGLDKEDYTVFKVVNQECLEVNLNYIQKYMEIILKYRPDDPRPQFIPYAYATFRSDRLLNFICSYDSIKEFINFCSTYEDNPIFKAKFNISFIANIAWCVLKNKENGYNKLKAITSEFKNILDDREDCFLDAKTIASTLYKHNIFD